MNWIKNINKVSKLTLILVYMVIIAGATVRMTGSGMGCPDWPKCFGYLIPPTEEKELLFKPNHIYKKGQVIIKDKQLWVAKTDFQSVNVYDTNNWEKYTKHDYAIFNPYHTWIEYINRLFGALSGIACIFLVISAFLQKYNRQQYIIWSIVTLILLGFNAWLGAKVVYSVLDPVRITTHMLAALATVACLIYILYLSDKYSGQLFFYDKKFKLLSIVLFIAVIIQITLGTQVRQFIDFQTKKGILDESIWLANPGITFYIHRSFSFFILFLSLYMIYYSFKNKVFQKYSKILISIIGLEVISGIAIYYFHFPFGTQAVHLVLAALLFGVNFYIILKNQKQINTCFSLQ